MNSILSILQQLSGFTAAGDIVLKASALLVAAAVAAAILRHASAAVRHWVWCLAFSGAVLLPALSMLLPRWSVAVLPSRDGGHRVADNTVGRASALSEPGAADRNGSHVAGSGAPGDHQAKIASGGLVTAVRGANENPVPSTLASAESGQSSSATWIMVVWGIGAMIVLVPLIVGAAANRLLLARCLLVQEGTWSELLSELCGRLRLTRRVRLLQTGDPIIPVTWGVFRPVVLVPAASQDWTSHRRRCVLLHELAHVKRLDVLFQVIARVACSLYWFNPLVWYALHRLRTERELACDDCVVLEGTKASEYATQLVELARGYCALQPAGLAMARPSNLEQRIVAILDHARGHGPLTQRLSQALALAAAILVALAAVVNPVPVARASGGTEPAAPAVPEPAAATTPQTTDRAPADTPAVGRKTLIHGRVIGPDDKPVNGARIWLSQPFEAQWTTVAETDARGAFQCHVASLALREALQKNPKLTIRLAVTADGLGFGWTDVGNIDADKDELAEVVLRMANDLPVEGRILTADGQPAAGVTPFVLRIRQPNKPTLDEYIVAARKGAGFHSFSDATWAEGVPGQTPAETDKEGRFRLTGIGAERLALLSLKGPTIHNWWIVVATRNVPESEPDQKESGALHLAAAPYDNHYYARFTHVSEPARTLRGTVRDKKTGATVAGAEVKADMNTSVVATSGPDGQFELVGCRKEGRYQIKATRAEYFIQDMAVADTPGLQPLEFQVDMVKGITARGRVTDKQTGKPVAGTVDYYPLFPNSFTNRLGEVALPCSSSPIGKDGTYEFEVLPGPGVIAVRNYDESYGLPRIDLKRVKEVLGGVEPGVYNDEELLAIAGGGQGIGIIGRFQFKALQVIKPDDGAATLNQDLVLIPGRAIKGVVLAPDGTPIKGVTVAGDAAQFAASFAVYEKLASEQFTVQAVVPDEIRTVLFYHPERHLGAKLEIAKGDEGPLTVRLQKCAAVTGRLVDAKGEPVRETTVVLAHHRNRMAEARTWTGKTDKEGTFRVEGLIPDLDYLATVNERSAFSVKLKPGDIHDAGTVRLDQKP